ncbi:hypothetical protein B0T17DRAFT_167415 [Bombardia bombarda]|uniref:Phytochrome n=1 Tax=Bombardia bombarda TaxID=252184 RepID=A0AA40C8E5_9PEZI|nr:hypothetical protein B0T17DRAFT_167415 [Bombardia bombarda]
MEPGHDATPAVLPAEGQPLRRTPDGRDAAASSSGKGVARGFLPAPATSTISTAWSPPSTGNSTAADGSNSNSTTSPTLLSSWSTASDRQLGHQATQQDHSDRVFPIRSVISVDPSEYGIRRRMSLSEGFGYPVGTSTPSGTETISATTAVRHQGQPPSLSKLEVDGLERRSPTSAAGDTPTTTSPLTNPATAERPRQRRLNTVLGSMSSIQADAERYGNVVPLSISFEDSSEDTAEDSAAMNNNLALGTVSSSGRRSSVESLQESLYTHRFKHIMTQEGHAVITGRDGKLERCEDEPIHTPGAVQGFGALLAIEEDLEGRFVVHYASENSRRIIGYSPKELFRLDSFLDILTDEQSENLLDHIDFIKDEDADPAVNGPEVFSISVRFPDSQQIVKLWCAIHIHPSRPELVICEFELDDDVAFPLQPPEEEFSAHPKDTLQSNPTMEELTESTEIMSKPLRVLRSARKKKSEAGAMQVFDIMSQVQDQLAHATNLERFLKILVGIVKELTGFHRVMIYQFDSSFNGKVVTELVDPAQTRDLYKGLHFPVTDIPKQARELYKVNKVRLLYDRDLETARIVCRSVSDLETPLDLTHSYLRAMSPIHLKYLANMAVRSSMSISINAFNDLWGLIACHSYGSKGMRVSFPIRKMCRLVGETVSRNIERLSYASRLQARKLINTVPTNKNPSGYIIASSDDLLKLFDADFGMLSIREETKILGRIEHSQEALAMLEYLKLRRFTSVVMSQDVKIDFPDLRYPPGFAVIAGLLYVPLSVGGSDFIVFFRRGQIREVKWAGNPYDKIIKEGTADYLEPRTSFKVWHETVVGKSREWSEEQVETAAVLCLVYGKFIEVWRQKEAALQSSRLTRLLLANSAHEVRTPLNAIINYLEIALEGSLDQETRDNLARSHSASKSLIYVINDLLDLTMTEEGQDLIKDEIFNLPACIKEATEQFKSDAQRKGISYQVIEHPGLPRFVYGDQRRVRQAVANITANAVQNTVKGFVRVELYVAEVQDNRVRIEIVVQDSGKGMSNKQLDDLFRDLEQVSTDQDHEDQLLEDKSDGEPRRVKTLGLGLAVVARILRNMDGQLRLKSETGKGSRFVIQLPFDLPPDDKAPEQPEDSNTLVSKIHGPSSAASVSASLSKAPEGEVLLVDRGSSTSSNNTVSGLSHKKSFDDTQSGHSHRTVGSRASGRSGRSGRSGKSGMSTRSDAERLIDAIQTPLALGEPESDVVTRQREAARAAHYSSTFEDLTEQQRKRSISPSLKARRPGAPFRSISSPGKKMEVGTTRPPEPVGMQYLADTKVPVKAVRIPDEKVDKITEMPPQKIQQSDISRILYEISSRGELKDAASTEVPEEPTKERKVLSPKLQVLVAEDDPINVKVLRKRLEKAGHEVSLAQNGEDCAFLYEEKPKTFDVVLMDMQMPIVDGLTSTKMIRAYEQTARHPGLSPVATRHGRIPIIAVSASLLEREKDTYVNAGFDGWILKPIDFKRLETLLKSIVDDEIRNGTVYVPGEWERGGWFRNRTDTVVKQQQAAEMQVGDRESTIQGEEATPQTTTASAA